VKRVEYTEIAGRWREREREKERDFLRKKSP
jgi:hypothetical protein